VAGNVAPHVSVLSAGEAPCHPTQGLPTLTIRQHKGAIDQLCVAIVGDVRHSRRALGLRGSRRWACAKLRLVAPRGLMPETDGFPVARARRPRHNARRLRCVMALRIQTERMAAAAIPDGGSISRYGLTLPRLRARPDAIVMHPQPMNRGIEIASEVADGPQSVIAPRSATASRCAWRLLQAVTRRRRTAMTATAAADPARAHRGTIALENARAAARASTASSTCCA
jgi:aspartate carbamoyltransferase catalytic subunit